MPSRKQAHLLEQVLGAGTVEHDLALGAHLDIFLTVELGEAPLLGDNDLLAANKSVSALDSRVSWAEMRTSQGTCNESDGEPRGQQLGGCPCSGWT